ncbi:MAG: outer membrane protein assembly factor BamA [Candidatus Rokubacteria bacterium RIFCSPLOWO2_12_FULL_73_47]|nr:MAG: outer membrane protein assembly factor BamA [Candidatus Rokubacteria bacterium RIFCSPLOWO2_12_FULL_73_47]
MVVVLAATLLRVAAVEAQRPQQPPITVKEIAVEGTKRVQDAVVLGRVKTTVGAPFNPNLLSEDIRGIFALGFFDDVQMRVEDFEGGVKVTFVVTERPFVRDVDFIGNKKLSTENLQEKINIKLGSVYNPVDVQRAVEKLKEYYEDEGYFEVQLSPDVEKFSDGDVRVTFNIIEGRRMTIDRIVVKGNTGLKESAIKDVLATRERQFFILRGTVQRQRLEDDVERVLQLYNDHGYVQARVESHDITVDREKARVTITFVIVEGPQFRVGDVTISGVTLFPEREITRRIGLKKGDVFSRSKLRESLKAITDLYSTIGHASADVNPKSEQSESAATISLAFEIAEGPEVYIERINISGNVRSQEKILRRELLLHEGELYTLQKRERSRQKLTNLGYFETVNLTTQPGSDKTKIVVNVEVTEKPTGLFSIGGGYSSVDSFIGTIDLAQRNFLGRGWEASIRIRAGANSQQGVISFTEPWLFDRPLSAGFDLFNTRRQYPEYDYDSLGGGLRLSHPFAEYWRWFTGYRVSRDEITSLTESATDALRDESGTRVTSAVNAALARDSRDNVFAPSRGGQTSLSAEFAGLGGDSRFVKTIGSTSYFWPVWFNHVVGARAEAGYGFGWSDEPLPLFERFYLGGPNSVRSFKNRRLSPQDEGGVRVGGTSEVLGNVEYIIPLPFNIRVAGFFDVGNAYGFGTKFDPTDTREAAGAGLRWLSPFGPLRLDYGVNLDRKKGEDFGAFHFSVGSPF